MLLLSGLPFVVREGTLGAVPLAAYGGVAAVAVCSLRLALPRRSPASSVPPPHQVVAYMMCGSEGSALSVPAPLLPLLLVFQPHLPHDVPPARLH
jgi:hypothetical protein